MLKKQEKEKLIKEFQTHENDTGSAEVQIVMLSENIDKILKHLKKNQKDNHTRRGLLKMVIKRKRLLKYLEKNDPKKYKKLTEKTGVK